MSCLIIVINTLLFFNVAFGAVEQGIQLLVYGGKQTTIEDAPFMAMYVVELPSEWIECGASILTDRFVLSAAHCYKKKQVKSFIKVGSDKIGTGTKFRVKKTIIHPKYNEKTTDYDVLVVKLIGKLKFSARVQPIKMAESNLVIRDGAIFDVYGFGRTENDYVNNRLRRARVPYVSQEKCRTAYNKFDKSKITDNMICAGEYKRDSCEGDSGGPLVYDNVLVGVVSFGVKCESVHLWPGVPGVYTRVSRVRKFIDNVIETM